MPSGPKSRIFIAEDDAGILELLRVRLELAGYFTFYARSGRAAIDAIAHVGPDAVILDIGLPGLDGFEVLRSLRASPRFAQTPVLMLTARHAQCDVRKAIAGGAQDYLTKPFDDQKLLLRVARLLRKPPRPNDAVSEADPGRARDDANGRENVRAALA